MKWPNKLVIHDFYLEDQFGDSLAFFGELEANISDYDLNERRLKINSIVLNDAWYPCIRMKESKNLIWLL